MDHNPDVKFIDARGWPSLDWLNTGGTRSKRVLMDDNGKEWYFKCSERKEAKDGKPEKHYKYEFWSEVIAYQIGSSLGLDVLRYDVAIHGNEIGCLSPLMINDDESLIEVGRYMTANNPTFLPENNTARKQYTFQLLEDTIDKFGLSEYWSFFLTTILFDAIIGNTDRHQENWAFIKKQSESGIVYKSLETIENEIARGAFQKMPRIVKLLLSPIIDKKNNRLIAEARALQLLLTKINRIAPIYDSGSSLGRELTDERVKMLLNDQHAFSKYVNNGPAEIHWEGKKITHFQLIENLLGSAYEEQLTNAANFLSYWNQDLIEGIIYSIDNNVPEDWRYLCIPEDRKALMIKILSSRTQRLKETINAGI